MAFVDLCVGAKNRMRVLEENGALGGIFGPKGKEVAGGCRRMDIEELHNLYASQNIFRAIKLRRVTWRDIMHAWKI
jgi:hypothetical protein